jgi:HlyD family secretion protein
MIKYGLVAAAVLAISLVVFLRVVGADEAPRYRLVAASKGSIVSTVTATGALNALVTVDVGTQVSGMIKALYVDYNSNVQSGETIARLDSAPFEAKLEESEAELAIARASVAMQEASLDEFEAELSGARAGLTAANDELQRKRELLSRNVERSSAVGVAVAAHEQARARVKAAQARLTRQKAQIELARAQVQQKAAAVQQRRLELEYTYIRSPVSGVVISRNVDAGQTVAASLHAPVLFRIAQDLKRMQVAVSVDEADIGRIRIGQKCSFSVDSFPGQSFEGTVYQIRKEGQEISNVITYTVVVSTENLSERLLPRMTANMAIVVDERRDVLKVPIATLRLRLPGKVAETPSKGEWVWSLDELGVPKLVTVTSGVTDGNEIEITQGDLREGQQVVLAVAAAPERSKWLRFGF